MIKIKNISKVYGRQRLKALDDVSFDVAPSEIVMITGPSGCGKTTLLNIIAGSLKQTGGEIISQSKKTGYVFQEDRLLPWKTVFENVKIVNPEKPDSEAVSIIEEVGLKGFESYYPSDLSGGMRHRCAIARALFYGSDMLLLDEPFKSLDLKLRKEMLNLVNRIRNLENTAVIFVTHDLDEALMLGDRILTLSKRPAGITERFKVSTPFEERRRGSAEYRELKEKIITLLEK